jgi:hypothetical protein
MAGQSDPHMKKMQRWLDFDRIPIVDLSTCTNPSLRKNGTPTFPW